MSRGLKQLFIGCALLGCSAAALQPPLEEPNEFHFVVLGDAQFHDPAKFNRVVDQTRRLGPAFVIQVGDLIEGYNSDLNVIEQEWQRFAKQIAPLAPIPFVAIAGNHDVYNGDKQVDPQLEALFEKKWGPLYFSFVYKNALIIGLNSDSSEGANEIGGQQWQWLRKTLKTSQQTHKFVFLHRPPMLTRNAQKLHDLFVAHGVSHVFYGHHHHYHFFERDGIQYTMTNAAANSVHDHAAVGGFHHLLQVSVRGQSVDVAVVEADAVYPQDAVHPEDNYDFFDLTRRLAPDNVTLTTDAPNTYALEIPLRNTSRRDIQVLVSCSSADLRWQFSPKAIKPIALPKGTQETLTLTASYAEERQPESMPQCKIQVPFQTGHGAWIELKHTVQTQR
jgi:predicted phosphodiesterase